MWNYIPLQYYAQRALTQGTPEWRDLQQRLFRQSMAQAQAAALQRGGVNSFPEGVRSLHMARLGLTLNPSEAAGLSQLGIPAVGTTTPNQQPAGLGLGASYGQAASSYRPMQGPTSRQEQELPTGYRWNWPHWYSPSDIEKVKGKYSVAEMMGTYIVPITESWLRQERERRRREAENRRRGWE